MCASRSDDPTEVLGEVRPSRAGDYALSYLHTKDLNMQVCIYASNYFMYIIGGTRDGAGVGLMRVISGIVLNFEIGLT